jgi:hypothetical protein
MENSTELLQILKDLKQSLKSDVEDIYWKESKGIRSLLLGSFDMFNASLILDGSLDEDIAIIIFLHEFTHFLMTQSCWGFLIYKLNSLQIIISVYVRKAIGRQMANKVLSRVKNNIEQVSIEELIKEASVLDKNGNLLSISDSLHPQAVDFMFQLEEKKSILTDKWQKSQEGIAYYLCIEIFRSMKDLGTFNKKKAIESYESEVISKLPPSIRDTYKAVQYICEYYKKDIPAIILALKSCFSPDFKDINILSISTETFEKLIDEHSLSPDKRLQLLYEKLVQNSFSCGKDIDVNLNDLFEISTAERFKEFHEKYLKFDSFNYSEIMDLEVLYEAATELEALAGLKQEEELIGEFNGAAPFTVDYINISSESDNDLRNRISELLEGFGYSKSPREYVEAYRNLNLQKNAVLDILENHLGG